ncbi:hypothetical protein RRG08_031689 [Elysia crispata]|uniref:Uncharacterized protein n=1 Tax=Elysia crispata TaxID=231223 RepID=A0AAE1A9K2_9GAST|nr:hypothetical protein RRG08_031689 [Elysia crispata]
MDIRSGTMAEISKPKHTIESGRVPLKLGCAVTKFRCGRKAICNIARKKREWSSYQQYLEPYMPGKVGKGRVRILPVAVVLMFDSQKLPRSFKHDYRQDFSYCSICAALSAIDTQQITSDILWHERACREAIPAYFLQRQEALRVSGGNGYRRHFCLRETHSLLCKPSESPPFFPSSVNLPSLLPSSALDVPFTSSLPPL